MSEIKFFVILLFEMPFLRYGKSPVGLKLCRMIIPRDPRLNLFYIAGQSLFVVKLYHRALYMVKITLKNIHTKFHRTSKITGGWVRGRESSFKNLQCSHLSSIQKEIDLALVKYSVICVICRYSSATSVLPLSDCKNPGVTLIIRSLLITPCTVTPSTAHVNN